VRLNEVINGRRQVSADSAMALGEAIKTCPGFWLNLQHDWDLWHAMDAHRKVPLNQGIPEKCLKQS
jgi:addiction module HigA family antidote